jgi:pimeloyl-ACP methyl ester carboxylesterase
MGRAAPRRRHLASGLDRFEFRGPAGTIGGWTFGSPDSGEIPALFIHPINLQGACWAEVVERLDPPRYSLLPDLRGHGGSDANGPYGLEHWAADCLEVLDRFGVERAHVAGGSLGGPLGVFLAVEHRHRIATVTAIGSALRIEGDEPEAVLKVLREKGVKGMFREVIPQISVAPGTPHEIVERILELANPNDADTVAQIWAATISADVGPIASRVRCPVLVASGEHDRTCTPEQGAAMAERLSTSLVVMPGIGHLPMLEDAAATADLVSTFLAQHEGRA